MPRWLVALGLVVLAGFLTLATSCSNDGSRSTATPTQQLSATPTVPQSPPSGAGVSGTTVEVPGLTSDDTIVLRTVTVSAGGPTKEHIITWRDAGGEETQHVPVKPSPAPTARQGMGALAGPFDGIDSAIYFGLQQEHDGKRELGVVYDATAYGSGSPTAHFALLRLDGDSWRVIWDVAQGDVWRGSHGRIEFPNGDLSELVVRSDDFSEGADELSGVIFEANAGPHRGFIDTWERRGDKYVRESAETVPSAYATLVEFMYDLAHDDDNQAAELVADPSLVEKGRSVGLGDWKGKGWLIACPVGDCGIGSGPISFDPRRSQGDPNAVISFVERNGQWLISDISQTDGTPTP
jgi:hypothetical protein